MSYPEAPARHVLAPIAFAAPADSIAGVSVTVPLAFGESAGAGQDLPVAVHGRLALRMAASAVLTLPVHRGHSTRLQAPWQRSNGTETRVDMPWQASVAFSARELGGTGLQALAVPLRIVAPWGRSASWMERAAAGWQLANPCWTAAAASWAEAVRARRAESEQWQLATPAGSRAGVRWQEAIYRRLRAATRWQEAVETSTRYATRPDLAVSRVIHLVAPWQEGRTFATTGSPLPIWIKPGVPVTGPAPVVVPLAFALRYPAGGWVPASLAIPFSGSGAQAQIVIPVRSFYMVQNDVTLYRLPSGAEFKATAFTLDIDADSWTFGWSATLHSSARPHLARNASGERAEVQCVVNGINLHLVVDSVGRDRAFPTHRIAVRGRGRAAELGDASLTFGNTAARTAQQLMADVLTVNNVSMGWGIDWQIADWLVPAGAWVHRGSYITALQDIAGAAGAYLQPHLTDKVLRVLPRYPIAPWDWATDLTPDVELPIDATTTENVDEVDRPDFNGVFVGGIGMGVFGPVVRTGTAGDKLAPQVLHSLITAPEAHRQAGLAVLGDTGRKERVSVSTLLLPEAGIILPGKSVRYVSDDGSRVGLVRRTGLSMQRWPQLTQTLEVETHVE